MADEKEPYFHRNNISFGRGRILYAPAGMDCNGVMREPSWVLPGGERTTNQQRAFAVAVEIDRLSNEAAAQAVPGAATWP